MVVSHQLGGYVLRGRLVYPLALIQPAFIGTAAERALEKGVDVLRCCHGETSQFAGEFMKLRLAQYPWRSN